MIQTPMRKALDIGAGTGNLTGKLLDERFEVLAIDISPMMIKILEKKYEKAVQQGMLTTMVSNVENINFKGQEFDLICFYSVLHHLSNPLGTLENLFSFLKKGGVIFIEHEASPYWQQSPTSFCQAFIRRLYGRSSTILRYLFLGLKGVRLPYIDYTFSDYYAAKIDHSKILCLFRDRGFRHYERRDYYNRKTVLFNPFSFFFRLCNPPDSSAIIAVK